MTVKTFMTNDPSVFMTQIQDTYGGQALKIDASYELIQMLQWWREWAPIFTNMNETVRDAVTQVKVLHELSKEQNGQPKNYSWTETTL
jgi:hypothetical protein